MTESQLPYSHTDIDGRTFYHGTKVEFETHDELSGGYSSNYTERKSPWIYFSETLHAAAWGAELARGEGRERIYVVEPTGPFMDDPNVTDKSFRAIPRSHIAPTIRSASSANYSIGSATLPKRSGR